MPYFATYIDKVPDGDVIAVLEDGIGTTRKALATVSEERAGYRYADGKWSIKEVLGHMSDTERIFTYRLLTFARGTPGHCRVRREQLHARPGIRSGAVCVAAR